MPTRARARRLPHSPRSSPLGRHHASRSRGRLAPLAALVVLAGLLGGCVAYQGASSGKGAPTPGPSTASPASAAPVRMRVGQIPILISAPLYIAQDKGYFAEAGVQVEFQDTWQASETLAGLASGQLDAGAGGIGAALFNGINRGVGIRIVAPLHTERPPVTTPLVVSKRLWDAGTVKTVADLRGRKVAINSKGSATEYWLEAALNKGGLTSRDVDVVALPFPEAVAAMAAGSLDAAMIGEPVATQGERNGSIVRLSEDFVDDFQVTAVYLSEPFARQQRAAGEAFLTGFLRGAQDLQGERYRAPENLAILEKYTRVPASLIAASRLPFHDPTGQVRVADFQKLQDFFFQQQAVDYTQPLDVATLVDPRFAEVARQRLAAR